MATTTASFGDRAVRRRRNLVAGAGLALLSLGLTACPPPEPSGPGSTATVTLPGGTVTVSVPAGQTVRLAPAALASLPPLPTDDFEFDLGALGIDVAGVPSGGITTLTITLPASATGVRKLISGVWDPFTFDGTTGATVSVDGLTLTVALQDGGRGDNDGAANGKIVDPLAPITKVRGGGTTTTTTTATPTSTTTTTIPAPTAGCYRNTSGNVVDFSYNGTPDQRDNLGEHNSADGTCTGAPRATWTLVLADSPFDAGQKCQALGLNTNAGNSLPGDGWTGFPTNAYYCPVSTPVTTTTTSTTTTTPALVNPAAGCYDNANQFQADMSYTGTPNVLGNATFHQSGDGSCGTPFPGNEALVLSYTESGAIAICNGLGRQSAFNAANDYRFPVPATTWICTTN